MADKRRSTDGPSPYNEEAWDPHTLPDFDDDFVPDEDIEAFAAALTAPENISPSEEDLLNPKQPTEFITALNDWRPVHQKVKGWGKGKTKVKKRKRASSRGTDETREGWTYGVLKYPLLILVFGWLTGLGLSYLLTRLYIFIYEQTVTWRGKRESLRKNLRTRTNYHDWVDSAKTLDAHLGSDKWKDVDEYAYYDSKTIKRVLDRLQRRRVKAQAEEKEGIHQANGQVRAIDDLRGLVEACVKNNFAGFENPRLYSETYYGTKKLVQKYVDEVAECLELLLGSQQLSQEDKRALAKHLETNFGRTALCLSGGATFAYYHFGIAKALIDADLLPSIITGTSGGALVAALLGTRTDEELKKLLIPALAARIRACSEPFSTWFWRWWRTNARFDSVDWARKCAWFCRGSLTFKEAYERTGRILNVSCVPSDPHSPTILANYLTAPDCVIWSAVLASAAVPGILNPVVLMRKTRDGSLEPYSFGHKWKDGSLRTDIPLKALNLHFNVNFSIVSQVNPHINLFFFSSRGSVGRPVTHRRGRGWRGGFLGSAVEQYLKLDLTKWLKVLRHLELLPRPLGQDWSEIWLQRFSGTVTIWPKTRMSDFYYILTDPTMERLARMIHVGQQAAFPKLQFISNRMKIEKVVVEARRATRVSPNALPTPNIDKTQLKNMFSEEDLQDLLTRAQGDNRKPEGLRLTLKGRDEEPRTPDRSPDRRGDNAEHSGSPSMRKRLGGWLGSISSAGKPPNSAPLSKRSHIYDDYPEARRTSMIGELGWQSRVFFDDPASEYESAGESGRHDVAPYEEHHDDHYGYASSSHMTADSDAEELRMEKADELFMTDALNEARKGK